MTLYFQTTDGERLTLELVIDCWRNGTPVELPPPTLELLDALEGGLDEPTGIWLVELVAQYPAFDPALTASVRDELLFGLAAIAGGSRIPFEIALAFYPLGNDAIAAFLARVPELARDGTPLAGLEALVDWMLDHPDAQPVVVAALDAWPDRAALRRIKAYADPFH